MIPEYDCKDWRQALEVFRRDGIVLLRGLFDADTVARVRAITDRAIDQKADDTYVQVVQSAPVLRNTQSLDPLFGELLVRPPLPELNLALLGPGYGFCGQNVIRSDRDQAISGWHVDGTVEFPISGGLTRHDARQFMPVFWYSVQIALSDILDPADGPTEVVPGSHYSGQHPPEACKDPQTREVPSFEGQGPVPVLCRAGDAYLFNHQLWHRGAPNRSGKRRYLMQNQYCQAWLIRRFDRGAHRLCTLPPADTEHFDPEVRRLLAIGG